MANFRIELCAYCRLDRKLGLSTGASTSSGKNLLSFKEMLSMKFILRILVNAVALAVTAWIMPNFILTKNPLEIIVVAIVFGLVNGLIKPIVKLLSLPITVVTLGLFALVINTAMLLLTSWLVGNWLSIEGNFLTQLLYAFLASILISIISTILNWFIPDGKK
jgi:putative membrane protein